MSAALAACRVAADAGEFFAPVEPPAGSPGEDWTSLSDLVAAGRELERFVAAARRALAEGHGAASASVPLRTAASMWFLGLTARLVSPPLAAALLSGQVPRLTPATVWCRPTGPVAMAPPGLETGARPAPALSDGALDPVVVPLLSAVAGRFRVSTRVLRGNVASAVAGAAGVRAGRWPPLAGPAYRLTAELLSPTTTASVLAGAGTLTPTGLRRHSCCLYYRVPGGGICEDCVLTLDIQVSAGDDLRLGC